MKIKTIIRSLWNRSPSDNFKNIQDRFMPGNDSPDEPINESRNDMLDPLFALSAFPSIVGWSLAKLPETDILLLGDSRAIESWSIEKNLIGKNIRIQEWNWTDAIDTEYSGDIVICSPPFSSEHWSIIFNANNADTHALRVTTIGELIAPFLQITVLMENLNYFIKSIDEVISIYLGKNFFGPLKELDKIFPLANKSVIEFGCFDGYQSLGLCHLNAKLTCLDARADNVIKTRAAINAVGFDVPVYMDDFHNAHASKYGRYDLAFAHGVYYHSVAPFVFLENLISLSDCIFLGGFCATENLPSEQWHILEYQGESYRAKHYIECSNFTAGVNNDA